jgi:flavin-dependent dehydrogenase
MPETTMSDTGVMCDTTTMPVSAAERATDELPGGLVDAVVIGGGAAGLNGALMLARSRRSVVVIDGGAPRNAPADGVRGLLGLDGIAPAELLRRGREEVRRYGGLVVAGEVTSAGPAGPAGGDPRFTVTLADGRGLYARRRRSPRRRRARRAARRWRARRRTRAWWWCRT